MGEKENKKMLVIFAVIVSMLLVILISILALDVPAIPVCVVVLLVAGISICLQDVPIWLHALAVVALVLAGFFTGNIIFMLLCSIIYVVGIFAFKFLRG